MCPVCGGYVALMTMLICDHTEGFLRVCYYLNWTAQRASPFSRFDTSDIDTTLCTHLVYAFGEIDTSQKTLSISSSTDYRHFNELKTKNPELTTLLSLGGDTDRGEGFLNVSQTDTSADTFATNTVGILRVLGFDGLDIYWIHKTTSENYLRLLRSIRRAFDVDPGSPRLLLTINILALRNELAEAPIIQEISKEYIDYAILMTFDFVSSFYDQITHYDSPLYAIEGANFNKEHSTEWAVSFYRSLGLPLHKTIIAVRGAGKWQVLQDTSLTDLGSPTKTEPYGTFFKVSPEYMLPGAIVYPEICRFMLSNASTARVFDEKHKAVYLVSGENWISYEDTDTIREKVTWARKNGLAGFMFWSLDQDDFSGTGCEQGRYPLLSTVKKVMEALDSSPDNLDTTSTDSVKTTHTTAPTKPPGALTTATRKTTETKLSEIETTVTMLSETKNKGIT
ncbi:chitinase-3-like protein 1 [Biomphalaria glabrata]|uniref:Chitinase-3-like protein 1 isoform X1 n=1 Tax=Biomphalaria glabrata TaxID=6526 RepID=A0A9U8DZZ5_BIOGL|nr:chitinase-3-like protein 1 isoform X1 [Biomphalaria glabrata]KAI8751343.1 chitinase-3-like protein 1 [Biomphalaria glabrata]